MTKQSSANTIILPAVTINAQVIPPNANRVAVHIKNTGNNPALLGPGGDASSGYFLGAGEEVVFDDANSTPSDFVQVTSEFGTKICFWSVTNG
ncbi:MAG: hypothetical protein V4563_17230 [Pseudomonadota bacterium]